MISTALSVFGLAAVANAHFQLQFPAPRGPFVEDNEPNFCDGYNSVTTNRTEFPLSGGFFTLNSEHPKWTSGVLISTVDNPNSFDNFSQIVPFFQLNGEGAFCIPLNLSSTNGTGLTDGQNATIQIVFDGGDGQLYQCADVTLSSTAKISSDVTCTNATDNSGGGGGASTSQGSSTTTTGSPAPTSAATRRATLGYAGAILGLVGVSLACL